MSTTVSPTGIASTVAFGTGKAQVKASASGIASTKTFGAARVLHTASNLYSGAASPTAAVTAANHASSTAVTTANKKSTISVG